MAFDEYQAERIKSVLTSKKILFEEKRMMGGWCVMVDDKMLCGLLQHKENGSSLLMARIGEAAYNEALHKEHVSEMTFTGRSMKGYVFVTADGIDREDDLEYWVQKCLTFNPLAKASKKKKAPKK